MAADADDTANRLARTQHGCFSRAQLIEGGVSPSTVGLRTRQRRWLKRASSVYQLAGSPPTTESRAMIGCLSVPESVVSHDSAAELLSMGPLDVSRDPRVHVSTTGQERREWLHLHRVRALDDIDRDVVRGVPCTSRARTLVDLAMTIRRPRYQEIFDRELASSALLGEVVAAFERLPHHGRAGAALVSELLERRLTRATVATSELERRFLRLVDDFGLLTPECQVLPPWAEPAGVGRVDFLYAAARLIVEVDGRAWHLTTAGFEGDRRRDQVATAEGWRTLRFTWHQIVHEPELVAAMLRRALVVQVTPVT